LSADITQLRAEANKRLKGDAEEVMPKKKRTVGNLLERAALATCVLWLLVHRMQAPDVVTVVPY